MKSEFVPGLLFVVATLGAGCVTSKNTGDRAGGGLAPNLLAAETADSQLVQTGRADSAAAVAARRTVGEPTANEPRPGSADSKLADDRYRVAQPPPLPASTPLLLKPIRPAREAVWIDGYWAYTGNASAPYEWMAGHWEIPPPDAQSWLPSGWQRNGNSYVYVRGQWR